MTVDEKLLVKVERLKVLLVSYATGRGGDNEEYRALRQELLVNLELKARLPRFLHTCRNLDDFWVFIQPKFAHYQERRDFLRTEFEPVLMLLEGTSVAPGDEIASSVISTVDSEHVRDTWQKALERRTSDPEGAITAARTLLETVCKHILDEERVEYDDKADLPKLYGLVAERVNLAPSCQ